MTSDTERGFRLAGRLRSGNVGINTAQRNMETPFGGFKMSGIGRDGGDFGLHAYTEMQSVVWPGMSGDRTPDPPCSRACGWSSARCSAPPPSRRT